MIRGPPRFCTARRPLPVRPRQDRRRRTHRALSRTRSGTARTRRRLHHDRSAVRRTGRAARARRGRSRRSPRWQRGDKPLRFCAARRYARNHFDPPLAPDQCAAFRIVYRANRPRHGLFFVDPTRGLSRQGRHAWTQSQDENARYWFPSLDYPHGKQTTQTTVVVPQGNFRAGKRHTDRTSSTTAIARSSPIAKDCRTAPI